MDLGPFNIFLLKHVQILQFQKRDFFKWMEKNSVLLFNDSARITFGFPVTLARDLINNPTLVFLIRERDRCSAQKEGERIITDREKGILGNFSMSIISIVYSF